MWATSSTASEANRPLTAVELEGEAGLLVDVPGGRSLLDRVEQVGADVSGRDLPSYPNPPNGSSSSDPACWMLFRNLVALAMTALTASPARPS